MHRTKVKKRDILKDSVFVSKTLFDGRCSQMRKNTKRHRVVSFRCWMEGASIQSYDDVVTMKQHVGVCFAVGFVRPVRVHHVLSILLLYCLC